MLRNAHRLCVSAGFASILLFCHAAWAAVEITHEPPDELAAGQRIALRAEVKDTEADVQLVRAYFRTTNAPDYVYAVMVPAADGDDLYTATLPAPAPNAGAMDYFLLVRGGDGRVVKSQNFTARVSENEQAAATLAALPPREVIVEPSEFAPVSGYHGRLVRLAGQVVVVGSDGARRSAAGVGYVVRESETVETGADGRVAIDFSGDPITVLDEASRLNVRTPSWLTHLAGKAYFAFKRLLGVSQSERRVASTVALIGIRGTKLISYAEQGVALKEGVLNVGSPGGGPLQVTRDGATATSEAFALDGERLASFDGSQVVVSGLTPQNLADFERFESFLGVAPGGTISAEAQVTPTAAEPVAAFSEQSRVAAVAVAGFDDFILLRQAPLTDRLGLAAAGGTVVAGTGGIGTTTIAVGALGAGLVLSSGSSGGGGGGSSSDPSPTPDPDPGPGPAPGFGSDFVGVTMDYMSIDGEGACLEVVDPCGQIVSSTSGPLSCNGFTGEYLDDMGQPPAGQNVSWSPAPAGNYTIRVIYCFQPGSPLPYTGDYAVSPVGATPFSGTLNRGGEIQTNGFTVTPP